MILLARRSQTRCRLPARPVALATLLLALPLAAGCGATCAELARHHAATLRDAGQPPAAGWHLALALPWQVLNQQLARYAPRDLPLTLPLAQGAEHAPPLRLRLESLKLRPAAADQLALEGTLAVLAGQERAFDLALSAELAPTLVRERRAVELGLEPTALRQAKITLAPNAAATLAQAIYRQLPEAIRRFVSPQLSRLIAQRVVEQLSSRLTQLLAERYGAQLAQLARLRLRLPDVPLRQLGLRSLPGEQGGLLVLAQANLALAGVADPARLLAPAELAQAGRQGRLLLALQPQAAVALLNQAGARGRLPRRFSYDGQPDPAGELQLTFGWQPDSHPLKVTIWKLGEERCAAVTFGVQPRVSREQDKLVLQLAERRLEQAQGRPLALASLWWQSLGEQASARQERLTRGLTLNLGQAEQHLRPVAASIGGERLLLELQPSLPAKPTPLAGLLPGAR